MKRFVVSSGWVILGLAALASASGGAKAGDHAPHAAGIPGIGPGTGVDVYIPNPDPQTPIAWSQGTEPPPPQGDYGGGVLQYMITGNETRPATRPNVQPPYFPARVAPVRGYDGRTELSTHARPMRGDDERAPHGYARPDYASMAYQAPAPASYGGWGFGGAAPRRETRLPAMPQGYAPQRALPAEALYDAGTARVAQPVQADIDPVFHRQEVAYAGGQSPGTVVIDTGAKFLYLVEAGGRAMRYGIGVAKPGFLWSGTHTITRKAEWPDWTPPAEMLGRRPDLPRHMEGGIANPLGARAMYLGSTLYRIHGTNEPNTIGTNVSSGCIRLVNDDVADLYNRVRVGTRVVVM